MIGTHISHYLILEKLGEGGMGVVYKAADTRLQRFVALKFLPEGFTNHPESRSRFLREARSVSALNHPNICTIYEVGEHNGTVFLAIEWLDGTTLREILQDHPLKLQSVIDIGVQVANALDAAHTEGIIHCDINVANIFLTKNGRVKVLDFGLAKRIGSKYASAAARSAGMLPWSTEPPVMSGRSAALGTAAYMSPEQTLGKELDSRTDLFSFGGLLYETATGKHPFSGETTGALFLSILQATPTAARELNPEVPEELQRIINKCLEKNRDFRYQHASEICADLGNLKHVATSESVLVGRPEVSASKVESSSIPGTGRPNAARHTRTYIALAIAATVIAIAATSIIATSGRSKRVRLTEKDTIVIADFLNNTGDPIFDDTLKTALSVSLRQSPFLNVLSASRVNEVMQLMDRPKSVKLTPEISRELCQRASSKAYIAGTIAPLGTSYVVGLTAVECQNGDTLAQKLGTAPSKEKVLDVLGTAASDLRGELGESLATLQRFQAPLREATTSSLEALKEYSIGLTRRNAEGPSSGIPYMERAIKVDPNFAMAYEELGAEYGALGELERSGEYISKAFEIRQHATEWERLAITAMYYRNVAGELEKARQIYEQMIETHAQVVGPYNNIGTLYGREGQYEKAMEWMRKAHNIDPTNAAPNANLCYYELAVHQFDQALRTVHEAQATGLDGQIYHNVLYGLAFLQHDLSATAKQQKWFADNPAMATYGFALASDTEAFAGHLRKARELTKISIESAIHTDNKEDGAMWWENAALREAAFGNNKEARRAAIRGLNLSPESVSVQVRAALAFGMVGDTAKAKSLGDEVDKRHPSHFQLQSLWLPAIRAQLALRRKEAEAAVNELQRAQPPVEYANLPEGINLSCLYTAYIRGESYLASGQGGAAAAEFQKILDHEGLVWNCWTGALAHLGIARANALQARTSQGADADAARLRALAAYQDFLTLWKDGDPDIPILEQAKAEYAKLQVSAFRKSSRLRS